MFLLEFRKYSCPKKFNTNLHTSIICVLTDSFVDINRLERDVFIYTNVYNITV
jgi:hypothetical protein